MHIHNQFPSGYKKYQKLKRDNVNLLKQDIKEGRYILRNYPVYVGIESDSRCNLKCIMCWQRSLPERTLKNLPVLEEKYLIKFAEQTFPTAKVSQLSVSGEPLLSRRLDLHLELAEKYGVKLHIITNGSFFNIKEKNIRRIVKNARRINFSFDSPVKETFESIRFGANFESIVRNMRLLTKYLSPLSRNERPYLAIGMVLMKRNLLEINQMLRLAKDVGINCVTLSRIHLYTKDMRKESVNNCKLEYNLVIASASILARKLKILLNAPPFFEIGRPVVRLNKKSRENSNAASKNVFRYCLFLRSCIYLDVNADLFPCCSPKYPVVGSIKNEDFSDIWNNQKYQWMRKTFTGGPCYALCRKCAQDGWLSRQCDNFFGFIMR